MTWIPWGAEARGKVWVGERATQRGEIKIAIKNVDFSTIEIRRQEEGAIERRQTFINRAAGGVIECYGCRVALCQSNWR